MRRGCLTLVGLLLGLVVIGFVYLSLNPPFSQPETGYLSRATDVEARLDAAHPTAAYAIHYGVPENVYANAYKEFPPLHLSAALVSESPGPAGMRLSLYPRDGLSISDVRSGDDGARLDWSLDCETRGVRRECARDAVLVLSGADLPANGVGAKIRLFAEQPFPAHVPTPFLVSLDLSADREELPGGAQLLRGAADGSHDLSPGHPVVRWSVRVDAPQAPVMGSLLTVTAGHNGTAVPTGFEAPPPVAVALLDHTGEAVVTARIRPGSPATFALPALSGRQTVVAWWQDQAVQSYDVSWRVEQAAMGSGAAPEISAGAAVEPASIQQVQVSGESETQPSGRDQELADLNLSVLAGSALAPNHVPSHLAIVQLRFTMLTERNAPVVIRANGAPVPLIPGAPVEFASGEAMNCLGYSCGSGVSVGTEYGQAWVRYAWDGLVSLWPLDPAADDVR